MFFPSFCPHNIFLISFLMQFKGFSGLLDLPKATKNYKAKNQIDQQKHQKPQQG